MPGRYQKLILLGSIFLTACLQTGVVVNAGEPDWLNGESGSYPNAQYVYATGSASDAETAQKRAQANLSKVFELRIRESATTTQEVQSRKINGEESVQSSRRIATQIHVSTSKLIEGARIVEHWQNPEDRTYFALAVLDRRQAGNSLRAEIERLDDATAFKLNQAQSETDSLLKIAALWQSLGKQDERRTLQKTLRVIDLSGRGVPAKWSGAELEAGLQQALKALQMQAVVTGNSADELQPVLRAAMSQAGFVVSSASDGYRLVLNVETQAPFQQQGWYWQRAIMVLELQAPDGGIRGQQSWPLKASASRADQLSSRLRSGIEQKLKTELGPTVLGFASAAPS